MAASRTLILATHNQGKVKELREPLARFGFEVKSLPEDFPDIEETGTTFEENALIKARAVADMLHLPAVADDSGLEVDALGKAPGVYSARYGQDWPLLEGESKDERNNRKLLAALEGCRRSSAPRAFAAAWPWCILLPGRALRPISSPRARGKGVLPEFLPARTVSVTIRFSSTLNSAVRRRS